ncbi:MAG: hypothetical protein A2571_02755 [Candidatus Vogelbacteria bacterium RIFOXYD1_FULL_44_32]|uniref:Photosynthesis system II assembly factor Ycf48/Hcf136-like domain-containing protein n=1 Tax=Candidatus Vogelbacteria bacterium RIFOXYD1_FULL_44_32 TaxID=1802438 RepID=A0A1G2QDK1_9BACT|nr:MAG: hypothetical protein A2571_02755 [Candidatus Vogelbacteria bacterium RIFOXYD1_FULL_44_32]
MKNIFAFIFILLACGCAPTVSHEATSGNAQFRIEGTTLQRQIDGGGWENLQEATAVSADQGKVYMISAGNVYESTDLGDTWQAIFSPYDPATDVEAVGGYLWVSVASWGTSSGINRRDSNGNWENLLWNSCYAVDVNPRHPDKRAKALVKEGGYDRYWVYAPLFPPYLWVKLWPAFTP